MGNKPQQYTNCFTMLRLTVLLTCLAAALATPLGVPEAACRNMMPSFVVVDGETYGHNKTNTDESPYTFNVVADEDNFIYTLTMGAAEGVPPFKGVYIRPFNNVDGLFIDENLDENLDIYNCINEVNIGVGHNNGEDKTSVTAQFANLDRFPPIFRATIVQSKNVFWTEVEPESTPE